MGIFKFLKRSKKYSVPVTTAQKEADDEAKATSKARLVATQGEQEGSELSSAQGKSLRKVF